MFQLRIVLIAGIALAVAYGCGGPTAASDAAPSAQKSSSTSATTGTTGSVTGSTGGADTGSTPTTTGASTGSTTSASTAGDTTATKYGPDDPESKRFYPLELLKKSEVTVGGTKIPVWVMETDSERTEGMMYLRDQDVPDKQGMIFVFDKEDDRSFWMQNTLIPLDIVYIKANGTVVNVGQGKPLSTESVKSTGKSKYVLELKGGMASKLGIKSGVKIDVPSDLHSQDSQQ